MRVLFFSPFSNILTVLVFFFCFYTGYTEHIGNSNCIYVFFSAIHRQTSLELFLLLLCYPIHNCQEHRLINKFPLHPNRHLDLLFATFHRQRDSKLLFLPCLSISILSPPPSALDNQSATFTLNTVLEYMRQSTGNPQSTLVHRHTAQPLVGL